MGIISLFTEWGGFSSHKADVEHRLTDLNSRSEHLARVTGRAPMTWHKFQHDQEELRKHLTPTQGSGDGLALGAALGIWAGVGASVAVGTFLGLDPLTTGPALLGSGAVGGVAGGVAGGAYYRSGADKREEKAKAYGKYLQEFEQEMHSPANPPRTPDASVAITPTASPLTSRSRRNDGVPDR